MNIEVDFKCNTCGHVFPLHEVVIASGPDARPGESFYRFKQNVDCPICNPPEPTYGPLTVENVAEALYTAVWAPDNPQFARAGVGNHRDYKTMARFVIRLAEDLEKIHAKDSRWAAYVHRRGHEDVQSWLNDLARQK